MLVPIPLDHREVWNPLPRSLRGRRLPPAQPPRGRPDPRPLRPLPPIRVRLRRHRSRCRSRLGRVVVVGAAEPSGDHSHSEEGPDHEPAHVAGQAEEGEGGGRQGVGGGA